MFVKKYILGVGFSEASLSDVLEFLTQKLTGDSEKIYVVTPNPELVVIAQKDKNYKKILNNAEISVPDGIGIIMASRILKISLKEKITGIDLMENICKVVAKKPVTAGFLGGGAGIAVKTAECLKKRYFGLKTTFVGQEIKNFSKFPKTDILFVAFGSPKQEIWIADNIKRLPVKAMIGVGGAFDMITGEIARAPRWMQVFGLEWLYRLIRQPWRAKRQLSLIKFIFLVIREKIAL